MRRKEGLEAADVPSGRIECDMASFPRAAAVLMAGALVVSGAPEPSAHACAFDGNLSAGLFDSSFQARYPKSSEVYFAIIDAIDQGALERSEFEATVPGPSGYWRAAGRLKSIQQRLSAVTQVEPRPERAMSVVFIESDLWARLEPGPQGFELILHTPGARDGDVVVVTSEGSIAAIMDGRLSAEVAFNRGLIAIDGEAATRDAIQKLLLAAFDPAPSSRSAAYSGGPAPVRFFGPRR
jgi:hypothetical protein